MEQVTKEINKDNRLSKMNPLSSTFKKRLGNGMYMCQWCETKFYKKNL